MLERIHEPIWFAHLHTISTAKRLRSDKSDVRDERESRLKTYLYVWHLLFGIFQRNPQQQQQFNLWDALGVWQLHSVCLWQIRNQIFKLLFRLVNLSNLIFLSRCESLDFGCRGDFGDMKTSSFSLSPPGRSFYTFSVKGSKCLQWLTSLTDHTYSSHRSSLRSHRCTNPTWDGRGEVLCPKTWLTLKENPVQHDRKY